MYISGKTKVDSQGRVNLNGLFRSDKMPKQVVLVVDVEKEMILVMDEDKAPDFGVVQKIDKKSRLIIPEWIREEVGNAKEFFLVIDEDKKYISPKTGDILPKA